MLDVIWLLMILASLAFSLVNGTATAVSASGALDAFASCLKPLCSAVGMHTEPLSLTILRTISGNGAKTAVIQLFERFGANSQIGQTASVFASASETTFYAVPLYFWEILVPLHFPYWWSNLLPLWLDNRGVHRYNKRRKSKRRLTDEEYYTRYLAPR